MATGDKIKFGTLYVDDTKHPFPTTGNNALSYSSGNIHIKDSESDTSNNLQWIEIIDGEKHLYICDRNILFNISWEQLNGQNLINGKNIIIDNRLYRLRLPSGGSSQRTDGVPGSKGNPIDNDWDKYINNDSKFPNMPDDSMTGQTGANNILWNWHNAYTWCQESWSSNSSSATIRGNITSTYCISSTKTTRDSRNGYRPILEPIGYAPSLSIEDSDLGSISYFNPISYSITDTDSEKVSIVEKVNGNVIRSLNNQNVNDVFALDLSSVWNNLKYEKHHVEIVITDDVGLTDKVNIYFYKSKHPIQKPSSNSTLQHLVAFNNELEKEISYQKTKLYNTLSYEGVNVSSTDKLSKLVDKANYVDIKQNLVDKLIALGVDASTSMSFDELLGLMGSISVGKKWASGKNVSAIKSGVYAMAKVSVSFDFMPTMVIVRGNNPTGATNPCHTSYILKSLVPTWAGKEIFCTAGNHDVTFNNGYVNENGFNLYIGAIDGVRFDWIAFE